MKLRFFIFTLFFLGLFCVPIKGYACATTKSVHKVTSTKCEPSKTQKQACCADHSNKKSDPCSGKCGSTKCLTSCTTINLLLNTAFEFEVNTYVHFVQKTGFYYVDPYVSTGFFSIWLPPKII